MQAVNPKLKLVLVGDGPVRAELQRQNPEYIFAGMRTGEDLAAHYASGDIFLFPSMTETYGNVTVEAMASGLAVVAYRYAAAAEHIVHERNGLHAEFGNEEEFVVQACKLAIDVSRVHKMRMQAHQTGRSHMKTPATERQPDIAPAATTSVRTRKYRRPAG